MDNCRIFELIIHQYFVDLSLYEYSLIDQKDITSIIAQIRAAFALVDTNRDGKIDGQELKLMLSRLKISISDAIIDQLISETSKNGDGSLTEKEFFRWMLEMDAHHDDIEGELKAAFEVFDIDNSGTIELEDLKSALELIGEPITDAELYNLLETADLDKDGSINYDEFIKLVLH